MKELADRVAVFRDGENAGELGVEEVSHDAMVKLMVGRDISQFYQHEQHDADEVVFEVEGLRTLAHPEEALSFSIRQGEVVGMAGLVGAGRTELLRSLFGVAPRLEGVVRVAGKEVRLERPGNAIREGIALVPEDRKEEGLLLEMAVRENVSLPSLKRDQRKGFLNREAESTISKEMIGRMKVKTPNDRQVVRYLSGGNQQKVVLGKWLAMEPKVLLLDEPTRGIDVGAKQEIYGLMEELAGTGVAILFVSSEMEEILGMSDRTLVMHEGRITGGAGACGVERRGDYAAGYGWEEGGSRMNKVLGIFGILVAVYVATWFMSDIATGRESFMSDFNQENLIRRTALFGIIGIGVAFVIITGGIDLSIGSVVCLVEVGFPWLLKVQGWALGPALLMVAGVSLGIGLVHGLSITKLRLPPFVVTLCGLLIYRGVSRGFTQDQTMGFGNDFEGLKWIANGKIPGGDGFGLPVPCLILLVVAIAATVFLNRTIYGRYFLALGNNEEAARFNGINTDRMIVLSYVICSGLAGFGGLLFVLNVNSAQPVDFGNFYEFYAIAAAVLGGCSLRGGEGTILGVVIGAALMRVLNNTITLVDWIPQNIEFTVVGAVILAGVTADELVKRVAARRRAVR